MRLGDGIRFALAALRGHRLRSGLSLAGMSIGIAAVIVLTALGEGARRYVSDQFGAIGTNLLIVVPGKTETTGFVPGVGGVPHDLTLEDFAAILRRVPRIRRGAPVAVATGEVARGDRRREVAVVGSTADFLDVRRLAVARGRFLPRLDPRRGAPVVVLGAKVARELFGAASPLGETVRVEGWRMRVIGVLAERGVQLGLDVDDIVVVPVATAMRQFDRSSLFRILLEVRSFPEIDTARREVAALVAARHGEEDVTVLTQEAVSSAFDAILTTLTLVVAAIASISLSVAGIGIMNVMLVSVSERTREVGLLRAVGAARRQIVGLFLCEAALLSAAGGVVGLAVGAGAVRLAVAVYPELPAAPPAWAVAAALGLALGIGLLFGVLPARRAARLDPIRALAGR